MERDIVPYWFAAMKLKSIIWAALANFHRYEKEKIAGGITVSAVREDAAATTSAATAATSLSR